MPPQVALLLTAGLIAVLFRHDRRTRTGVTNSVWFPLLWLLVIIGKPVAEWLAIVFGYTLAGPITIDSIVWTILIFSGLLVLNARRVTVAEVFSHNRVMVCFVVYSGVAVLWSDIPYTSFKHWIAILGHPIMALILLTEPDPEEAFKSMMKRCLYVAIPISILLIRYYPQWGRSFSVWTGDAQKAGFANDKNSLGVICMLCGFFLVWNLLNTIRFEHGRRKIEGIVLSSLFLAMILWLFKGLNCGTALVAMCAGIGIVFLAGLPVVDKRMIRWYAVFCGLALFSIEAVFDVSDSVTALLGKDGTLTGRTEMWPELLKFDINPLVGAGYESFWHGERLATMWGRHWWKPNQAHNGYLETYLNLGFIGVSLLVASVFSTFSKSCIAVLRDYRMGLFRLGMLGSVALYNWTEAGFKTLHPVFFMFFVIAMDYPQRVEGCSSVFVTERGTSDLDSELQSGSTKSTI